MIQTAGFFRAPGFRKGWRELSAPIPVPSRHIFTSPKRVMTPEPRPGGQAAVFHMSVLFAGRVQGVGFRYQTTGIARGFEVTGYVRNLTDGRVELEVEGAEAEARAFVEEIEDQLSGYIRSVEKKESRRPRKFFDFTIK